MAAHVLLVDVDAGRSRRHAPSSAGEKARGGRPADILLGDFDRARTEATFEVLRKNLPANEIHRVRSGCEALAFLKRRGELPDPKRPPRPLLALLDETLGDGGPLHLGRLFRAAPPGGLIVIVLAAGAGFPLTGDGLPTRTGTWRSRSRSASSWTVSATSGHPVCAPVRTSSNCPSGRARKLDIPRGRLVFCIRRAAPARSHRGRLPSRFPLGPFPDLAGPVHPDVFGLLQSLAGRGVEEMDASCSALWRGRPRFGRLRKPGWNTTYISTGGSRNG